MIALQQLPAVAGLAAGEMVLCGASSARDDRLLSNYMFNIERRLAAVRDMMVGELRRFFALGARREAADRLIVLRRFLGEAGARVLIRGAPQKLSPMVWNGLCPNR